MKITSREPAVIHSPLDITQWLWDGHHLSGMLHSDLERTHILNYVWSLLLDTSCTV